MAVVYITEGRVCLLERLRLADSVNWRLGLYQTPITPGVGDAYGSYDSAKATYVGYGPATPTWSPAVAAAGLGKIQGSTVTFTGPAAGSPNTIYGYYLFHVVDGKVLFADTLPSPKVMGSTADLITITPAMTENQG